MHPLQSPVVSNCGPQTGLESPTRRIYRTVLQMQLTKAISKPTTTTPLQTTTTTTTKTTTITIAVLHSASLDASMLSNFPPSSVKAPTDGVEITNASRRPFLAPLKQG
ncbi:unnamed protein product [Polarella glacialis]|uniref:Uncharacterized protein n=1 Tax=Polarella glacialis TaxID=89957 RepID=A0A813D7P9_POLGL|nr:unnamed protein product [Polarella glacialis]